MLITWLAHNYFRSVCFLQPQICVCLSELILFTLTILCHCFCSRCLRLKNLKANRGDKDKWKERKTQSNSNYPLAKTICVIKSPYTHESRIKSNYSKSHTKRNEKCLEISSCVVWCWALSISLCLSLTFPLQAGKKQNRRQTNLTTLDEAKLSEFLATVKLMTVLRQHWSKDDKNKLIWFRTNAYRKHVFYFACDFFLMRSPTCRYLCTLRVPFHSSLLAAVVSHLIHRVYSEIRNRINIIKKKMHMFF